MVPVVNFTLCLSHTAWVAEWASEQVWAIGRIETSEQDRQLQLRLDTTLLPSVLHVSTYEHGALRERQKK